MSNYCKECYKKQEEIEQLKQALQEIKDMIAKPYCCKPQDVIDKINEVIGAE